MVIWLIGLSGVGKSTLGRRLKAYLDSLNKKTYLIDGDIVRDFYDGDLGYSRDDRIANIKRIILASHVLSENGVIAIVCNISPFEHLRAFARKKIKRYTEIFLKKDITTCQKQDKNNMYSNNLGKTEIVGINIEFDKPRHSDLVVDTGRLSVEESFIVIKDFLFKKYPKEFI